MLTAIEMGGCYRLIPTKHSPGVAFQPGNLTTLLLPTFRKSSQQSAWCSLQCQRTSSSMSAGNIGGDSPAKLVSASWLKTYIDEGVGSELTLLDVRGRVLKDGGRVKEGFQPVRYVSDDRAYFEGHIPDARFVDWRNIDLSQHTDFCDRMAELGVQQDIPICIYDWGDMLFASRLWLALTAMGCQDVRLLDGGWTAWDRVDGPVSLDTSCPLKAMSEFESPFDQTERPFISISLEEMKRIVENENPTERVILLDARSQKQYRGEERRSKRAGHIKGAVNLPYRRLLNEDGIGLRPDAQLKQVFEDASASDLISGNASLVTYCNGGVASSLALFAAIRNGVSMKGVRNYCGSFNEWGNREDTMIQKP